MDREGMVDWAADVRETSERLRSQRQRCDEIPRDGTEKIQFFDFILNQNFVFPDPPTPIQDRIIQACSAAWSASFAYETARLMSDLQEINPELAAELREHVPNCFGGEAANYHRILKNIF